MEKQIELVDHERILGSTYRVLRETMLPEDVEALGRELTIRTEANAHSLSAPKEVRLMELEDDWVAVPRFFGLQRFGEPDVDVTVRGERRVDSMVFSGSLDASRMQPECASKVAERLDDGGGGTLVMPCGMGKTCVALHCACRFAVRTLVVVPTTVLATQWVDRITFFCPRATAVCMNGAQRLQDTEQYAGCDFVVTTIQTLSLCTIPEPIMQLFGLTIVDEAHGFCAPTFSTAARKIFSARILALSATPERKDGLHEGMPHLLGDDHPPHRAPRLGNDGRARAPALLQQPVRARDFVRAQRPEKGARRQDDHAAGVGRPTHRGDCDDVALAGR